ncbi:MAG: FkbM family methyltransferase [Geminicoccaceae bacterium]
MIEHGGLFYPDLEKGFQKQKIWLRSLDVLEGVWPYIRRWDLAVDVGAFTGIYSIELAKRFKQVWAFEPIRETYECLQINVPANVATFDCALGLEAGEVDMYPGPAFMGWVHSDRKDLRMGRYAKPEERRSVKVMTLDGLLGGLEPDFIKTDCEGYDGLVLQGGREVIERCRPVILAEDKGKVRQRYDLPFVGKWLEALGYRLEARNSIDFLYVHPEAN